MKRSSSRIAIGPGVVSAIVGLALVGATGADAAVTTFSNPTTIIIPASGTGGGPDPAAPYPSTIVVSGITNPVIDVNVTLFNLSHAFTRDIDLLLVGPAGQNILLLSDVGGTANLSSAFNVTITLDQDAASNAGTPLVSGTFRPTNEAPLGQVDSSFPAPAPIGPYTNTMLDAFNGVDPNGIWSLYVIDDALRDTGDIAGGWSLTLETQDQVAVAEPASLALLGVGLAGLACARRRRGTLSFLRGS